MNKFRNFFSKRPVSPTETRSTRSSSQSADESPDLMSSSTAAGRMHVQATASKANQMVPHSINHTPNDRNSSSSADQPRRSGPALKDSDKFLSAMQAVSGMVLPLSGLPEVAKSASHLLTMLENKSRNDDGVRDLKGLTLSISELILGLVDHLQENPTVTAVQERVFAELSSYLETLNTFCEEYQQQNSFSRFLYGSAWKEKIEDVRRGIQTQVSLVQLKGVQELLNRLSTPPHVSMLDQCFHDAEIAGTARINNFTQSGLDQSRPVPRHQIASNAFKGAKIGPNTNINNHHLHFGNQAPW